MTARLNRSTSFEMEQRIRVPAANKSSEKYRAPFLLRCGAVLIDYTILAGSLAISTMIAMTLGGGARVTGETFEALGYLLIVIVALINFVLLPAWRGQTLGKWATGLRIERKDGAPLSFARVLIRHLVGYQLSLITLGGGYIIAIFSSQGRALHDLIAGTRVVREEKRRARGAYD